MPEPAENNLNAPGATRLRELDALRGIAIIAVVALHSTWPYLVRAPVDTMPGHILALLHLAAGLGVPLFIALSAAALTIRYGRPQGWGRPQLQFIARRAWRLLPAYALWSAVSGYLRSPNLLWPPGRYVSMLLLGSADAQFYFVPLIFELYLLWPLFQRLSAVSNGSPLRQTVLVLATTLVSGICWKLSATYRILASPPWWFGFWLLYVGAGIVAGQNWSGVLRAVRRRPRLLPAMAALAVFGLAVAYAEFAATIRPPYSHRQFGVAVMPFLPGHTLAIYTVVATCFVLVTREALQRTTSWLALLGRESYGIYLTHLLVLYPTNIYLIGMPVAGDFDSALWLAKLAVSFGLTFVASTAVSAALARWRMTAWAVGRHEIPAVT